MSENAQPQLIVTGTGVEIPVKVNPFTAENNTPSLDDLANELNPILGECEEELKKMSSEYNLIGGQSLKEIPINIIYKPAVTTHNTSDDDAFNLKRPSTALKVEYKRRGYDTYCDRIFLNPFDVEYMLKDKKNAKKILSNLVKEMAQNVINEKKLDKSKKYEGSAVFSIKRIGYSNSFATNYQDDYIELRMWSNATESQEENDSITVNSTESSTSGTTTDSANTHN